MHAALAVLWLVVAAPVPTPRHRAPVLAFMRAHPCPGGPDQGSTTRCRGYRVDHRKPLCAGGDDDPSNMQWQDEVAARQKDYVEWLFCRHLRQDHGKS